MKQSATRSAITAISKYAHMNVLKAAGFRRSSNHMYRPSNDLFHGIHFQASQWGSASEGHFTINLVVTSQFLYRTWTGSSLPTNPATAAFPVTDRIGSLMPQKQDHWWPVTVSTDLQTLSTEISEALTLYALPFFEKFPDSRTLLQCARDGGYFPGLTSPQKQLIHAMLAAANGFKEEASEVIRQELDEVGASPFRKTVESIGKKLGVL